MKITFFRSKTTDGDTSHTYVDLQKINGDDVAVIHQRILVKLDDAEDMIGVWRCCRVGNKNR